MSLNLTGMLGAVISVRMQLSRLRLKKSELTMRRQNVKPQKNVKNRLRQNRIIKKRLRQYLTDSSGLETQSSLALVAE